MTQQLTIIVDGPDACRSCLGWGHIANDDDGTPWQYWAELPAPENIMVQIGIIRPIPCPTCQGTGKAPDERAACERRIAAAEAMVRHWQMEHHNAHVRIGRISFALEQACKERRIAKMRAWLNTAIAEIEKEVGDAHNA